MGSKKQWAIFLTATVLTVCLLAVTVLVCAGRAGKAMRQHSFDELAEDYYSTIKNDQMFLSAIAELIARQKLSDVDTLLRVMNSFSFEESFLTQLILLMPDGQLLHSDGTWYDVSDRVDFAEEARKGAYISDRVASLFAPEQQVVRSAMPVKRNGETVAILYGVIFLTESRRAYSSDYYSGNAFILVIDGNTGDILLDTWHDTLGNLADMSDRKMLDIPMRRRWKTCAWAGAAMCARSPRPREASSICIMSRWASTTGALPSASAKRTRWRGPEGAFRPCIPWRPSLGCCWWAIWPMWPDT